MSRPHRTMFRVTRSSPTAAPQGRLESRPQTGRSTSSPIGSFCLRSSILALMARLRDSFSISAFGEQVQEELRKESDLMAKLQQQTAHALVVEVGHQVDARHASITKQIQELTELVRGMVVGGRGHEDGP